jgi:TonB family protein
MPTIIQLPPLYEERKTGAASSNGNPVAAQRSLNFPAAPVDPRLFKNPFALLGDDLESDRERARLREAFWISLVVHAVLVLVIIFIMPKWLVRKVVPSQLEQLLQDHDITFLQLPPSPVQPPKDADRVSDQDRIAALRHPAPDAETLHRLLDSALPGAPGAANPSVAQPAQQSSPQSPASRAQQQARGKQTQAEQQRMAENGQPHAPFSSIPQTANGASASSPFNTALSAGSQIQQALRASAQNHTDGSGGDYGTTPSLPNTKLRNQYDILSDTMGVDFGPYLSRVLSEVKRNWISVLPEEALPPLMKQGKVAIEFVILKDGSVAGMRRVVPSGDAALDRAAWASITASNPFQPLPQEFRGENLKLRFYYYYNPSRSDLQ